MIATDSVKNKNLCTDRNETLNQWQCLLNLPCTKRGRKLPTGSCSAEMWNIHSSVLYVLLLAYPWTTGPILTHSGSFNAEWCKDVSFGTSDDSRTRLSWQSHIWRGAFVACWSNSAWMPFMMTTMTQWVSARTEPGLPRRQDIAIPTEPRLFQFAAWLMRSHNIQCSCQNRMHAYYKYQRSRLELIAWLNLA